MVPQLARLTAWDWLSRHLAVLRTQGEPQSRAGPNRRLQCGCETWPKSPTRRSSPLRPRLVNCSHSRPYGYSLPHIWLQALLTYGYRPRLVAALPRGRRRQLCDGRCHDPPRRLRARGVPRPQLTPPRCGVRRGRRGVATRREVAARCGRPIDRGWVDGWMDGWVGGWPKCGPF